MNVTDVAPVRVDEPAYMLAIESLFVLVALVSFFRVSTYVVQQARQGTLVNSPRSPLVFPIAPWMGWAFAIGILALFLSQSVIALLTYVLVPAGVGVFLAAEKRSAEYQFGLVRVGASHLVSWTLVVCAAFFFIEIPLSHLIDRAMTWLQMAHPPQPTVEMFRQIQSPDLILKFILTATLVTPFVEELFFRGFLFSFLKRFIPTWGAIVLSAAIFAIAHANVGSVVQLWLLGVVLAVAYEHSGSLLLPMGIHGCFNLVTALTLLLTKDSA
jgi:membrane protease YdiL (CAAX protease family)